MFPPGTTGVCVFCVVELLSRCCRRCCCWVQASVRVVKQLRDGRDPTRTRAADLLSLSQEIRLGVQKSQPPRPRPLGSRGWEGPWRWARLSEVRTGRHVSTRELPWWCHSDVITVSRRMCCTRRGTFRVHAGKCRSSEFLSLQQLCNLPVLLVLDDTHRKKMYMVTKYICVYIANK